MKTLKKLLITFSIVLTVSYAIVLACAPGEWGIFGNSNFTPDSFVEESYSPLLYTQYEMFYGIGYDDKKIERFNDEIKGDWSDYLANKLKAEQLSYFLLNDSSKADIEGLYSYISKSTKNASYNQWNTKVNLNDQKVKNFLEFVYFAKQIEKCSAISFDPWDYDNKKETPKVDSKLITEIQNKYETVSDPFLKNRYWFQSIKALFYSASNNDVISFFKKTKNDKPQNTLFYRAVAYVAGVYKQQKDYASANYLYSVVFDKCPAMRVTTAYNFHPQEENDWKAALDLAKTNNEKAALWALLGYYADAGRSINEIFKLNPQSPHLDYLLTRLVNIQEDNIHFETIESVSKFKAQAKANLNKKDLEMIDMIAQSGKAKNQFLWNLADGYLQSLNGNYSEAKNLFAKAEKQIPKTDVAKNQLHLLRFINTLSEIDNMSTASENLILPDLKWLYTNKSTDIRYDAAVNWSKKYIAALYTSNNNVILSEMFNPNKDFYKNNDKIEVMKSFLSKTDKTPFEKMAESIYDIKLIDIFEYQAILFAFDNKIELAFENMQKAGSLADLELLGNPFNGNILDCHDCDHQAYQKTKYSKKRFIEVIKIMQDKVKNGEDLYNNCLLLGNAFYNMSYFGNARLFYQTQIIDSYDNYYDKIIYDCSNAKMYYQKALDAAANDEQKAKCNYMLAKCERNEYYVSNNMGGWGFDSNGKPDFKAWDGFANLKAKYSATKYYKDVIRDCGYFKSYASKH